MAQSVSPAEQFCFFLTSCFITVSVWGSRAPWLTPALCSCWSRQIVEPSPPHRCSQILFLASDDHGYPWWWSSWFSLAIWTILSPMKIGGPIAIKSRYEHCWLSKNIFGLSIIPWSSKERGISNSRLQQIQNILFSSTNSYTPPSPMMIHSETDS